MKQSFIKREQNLEQLLLKYEKKDLKGDFLTFEIFFYDILSPKLYKKLSQNRRTVNKHYRFKRIIKNRLHKNSSRIKTAYSFFTHRVF